MRISFTITTNRRLDLFFETMESFLQKCKDKHLINRWICSDDRSSEQDIKRMKEKYPFLEIYKSRKGQPASLNYLFSQVKTEWVFHCEDDWEFLIEDNFITKLFKIAEQDERLKNISLRGWEDDIRQIGNIKYNIHHYKRKKSRLDNNTVWYGFTFNPSLIHIPTMRLVGKLSENRSDRKWDKIHAIKYMRMGFKTANLVGKYIKHIGEGKSFYD